MTLPLIYIAGPFRGVTPLDVRRNVEAARDYGLHVAQCGGYPIIPHTMTAEFDKQLTDQFWLNGTMELLKRCDAMLLGPKWRTSSGALTEVEWARTHIPVFNTEDEGWPDVLTRWVEAWKKNRA